MYVVTPQSRLDGTHDQKTQRKRRVIVIEMLPRLMPSGTPLAVNEIGTVFLKPPGARTQKHQPAERDEGREPDIAIEPITTLLTQCKIGLQQYRIGEQSDQAATVARRIQEIGISRSDVATLSKPLLQQRCPRGNYQKRKANRGRQTAKTSSVGLSVGRENHCIGRAIGSVNMAAKTNPKWSHAWRLIPSHELP